MKADLYIGNDFYCDMVFSGKLEVEKILETENVLAFKHTKPTFFVHIVVVPKQHIPSILSFDKANESIFIELLDVIKQVATKVEAENGAVRVITNIGDYQDSKHLHFHLVYGKKLDA